MKVGGRLADSAPCDGPTGIAMDRTTDRIVLRLRHYVDRHRREDR